MRIRQIFSALLISFVLCFTQTVPIAIGKSASSLVFQSDAQSWIAYIDKEETLHIVHPDGSGDRLLYQVDQTVKSWGISLQGWSVHGHFLAFYVYRNNDSSIFVWDSQREGDLIELKGTSAAWEGIRWNPQEEHLFATVDNITKYTQTNPVNQLEIWNVLNTNRTIVNKEIGTHFEWSPDGKRLFYDMPYMDTKAAGQSAFCPEMPNWISYDGIYVYDIETATSDKAISAKENPLILDGVLPNGKELTFYEVNLFCTGMDGPCMHGPLQQASIDYPQQWGKPFGSECVWSPDGETAVCGGEFCQKDPLKIIDSNGHIVQPLDQFDVEMRMNSPYLKKWSPNNQKVAIVDSGFLEGAGSISIWDSQSKQVYMSGDHVKYLDWSPDGRYFVTTIKPENKYQAIFVVFDDQTKTEVARLGQGNSIYDIAWQPMNTGQASINDKIWRDWITRKKESIGKLNKPEYDWLLGESNYGNIPPLPRVDESAAQQLLTQIPTDPAQLTSENQEAFYRLLLQEESLVGVHEQYINTTEDHGETWADIINLSLSSLKIYAGHETAVTVFRSLVEDATDIVVNINTDPQQRDDIRTITDLLFLYVFNGADLTGYAKDLGPEVWMKWLVARENQRHFNTMADPLIHQGVNSVFQGADPYWSVGATRMQAEDNTGYLVRQSKNFTSFSHENYQNTRDALDVVEVLNDVADLAVQVTKGSMPWYIAASKAVTTSGIVFLNWWKLHVNISPALSCNLQMAEEVGVQSFNPVNPNDLPICEQPDFPFGEYYDPIDRFIHSIDGIAWTQFSAEYSATLAEYSAFSGQAAQNITSGRPVSAQQRKDAEQLIATLESTLSMGSAILAPPTGMTWDAQTFVVKQNMMELKAQTILFLLTMDLTKSDLADPAVQNSASQNLEMLQKVIQQNKDILETVDFSGSPVGIPFIESINQPITASQGESLEFEIRVKNIGGGQLQAGELTAAIVNDQKPGFALNVPTMESGQEQVLVVKLEPFQSLPTLAILTYTAGTHSTTRTFEVVEISPGRRITGNSQLILVGGMVALMVGALMILGGFIILKKQKNTKGKTR